MFFLNEACAISYLDIEKREYAIVNDTTCNDVECQLKDSCDYYKNVVNASTERIDNIMKLIVDMPGDLNLYGSLYDFRTNTDQHMRSLANEQLDIEDEATRIADEAENDVCPHGNDWNDNCEACNVEDMIAYGPIEDLTDEQRTMRWVEQQLTRERRNDE